MAQRENHEESLAKGPLHAAYDLIVIGSGIAGLSFVLHTPEGTRVALLTKGALGESNTRYAQGGLAAPVGPDDSPELHIQDTLAAGAGLCNEEVVRVLLSEASGAVQWLIETGTRFDREGDAANEASPLLLGHEAAHSRRRVLHARGDATGAEIERALVAAVRARPNIEIYESTAALDLLVAGGYCAGVLAAPVDAPTARLYLYGKAVVLANGGAGQLWRYTSNPDGATADGAALAYRAGAALTDLEFMQFHPTVLVDNTDRQAPFLISEAVRGEGAYLRNSRGERFMPRYHHGAELAPRDVVARAISAELASGPVTLDLSHLDPELVARRFPNIARVCRERRLDLARDPISVAPAAHYFMGGVAVNKDGRTTLPGLYAIGEVACTGVHGANRLASNSLLEGLVFARRAARDSLSFIRQRPAHPATALIPADPLPGDHYDRLQHERKTTTALIPADPLPGAGDGNASAEPAAIRQAIQEILWQWGGLHRTAEGLTTATQQLAALQTGGSGSLDSLPAWEARNMLTIARLIIRAAQLRCESRGAHHRLDYPYSNPAWDQTHWYWHSKGHEAIGSKAPAHTSKVSLVEEVSYV